MSFDDFRLVAADAMAGEVAALLADEPAPYLVLEDVVGPRWYTLRVDQALRKRLRASAQRQVLAALKLKPRDGQKSPPWQDHARVVVINALPRPVVRDESARSPWRHESYAGARQGSGSSLRGWRGGGADRGVAVDAPRGSWADRSPRNNRSADPARPILESLPPPHREEAQRLLRPDISASVSTVSPDEVVTFKVALLPPGRGKADLKALAVTIPAEVDFIKLVAVAHSPGFERVQADFDDWSAHFRIYREEIEVLEVVREPLATDREPDLIRLDDCWWRPSAQPWTFSARALRDVDAYKVTVEFKRGAQVVGSASIELRRADSPAQNLPPPKQRSSIELGGPHAEGTGATLHITQNGIGYDIRLNDQRAIPFPNLTLANAKKMLERLELIQPEDREGFKKLGRYLWNDLPEAVQNWLRNLPAGQPLIVFNDPPFFLFELVWYLKEGETGEEDRELMLGAERPVLRSVGRYFQPDGAAAGASCVCPTYAGSPRDLPSADEEVQQLQTLMTFTRLARTKADFLSLLKDDKVALVHIVGHGAAAPSPALLLQDGPVEPVDFQDGSLLRKCNPFIFLNVCKTGETSADESVAVGNFPKVLLQNGASGVMASMIEVNSEAARDAALLFYQALRAGETVGEAARRLRAAGLAEKQPGLDGKGPVSTPAALSYLVFATPSLRLTLPPPIP